MSRYNPLDGSTICALASVPGTAAIAIVRVSGPEAFEIVDKVFVPVNKSLSLTNASSHTVHYGSIFNGEALIDEVLVNIYKRPASYTGENTVEIFCHGSVYIQQQILELLIEQGCRLAQAGEFTLRAFMNGKLDLSQAEAVADLIAANSKAAHNLALKQMRGGYSKKIEELRQKLIKFTSLIELELDFSEEDLEFADRKELQSLIHQITQEIQALTQSFSYGNVLKKGIPVAIIGQPNVGKSTLLNALLNEDRALVSAIPGTTRDAIEDTISIEGFTFRFIDTAGLRDPEDEIEHMGIDKTYEKMEQAHIILFVFDIHDMTADILSENLSEIEKLCHGKDKTIILVGNKSDLLIETPAYFKTLVEKQAIYVSAKRKKNINMILERLTEIVRLKEDQIPDSIVSNSRHYEALTKSYQIVQDIAALLQSGTSHELLAADMRRALYYLSEITGVQINNEDILDEIFSNFCIGK